ncbi:glycosyltransferase family 4 protein [Halobellus sp. H-GB7]|uniref:glycosyltransferase family 4 protein n=1 Tax=Halobellus sp. H-GB7 TaxID=3069756 RepID=UPI0027B5725C|nr:glycosyltransferase family 4 protein [Halobellus sp. H-GB7]MDQ2053374.1 glycosyltransferase family 4 protein [Halobellus sp. H-GB7]
MRVAFVSLYPEQRRSDGATRRTRRVAEHLAARGHDVVFLCSQWWDGELDAFEQDDVEYVAVSETPSARTFASKLPFALRRADPDVIHATNSPPSQVVAAKTAARVLRVPVVVDWWAARGDDSARMLGKAATSANRVLTPSRMVKTDVREHGAPEDAVTVVPESIDVDLVRESDVDNRADLVYARHLDEHANVESFLLALAELRDRDWRAAIIGDGPERDAAEQTAAELRIDDRVEFLGDLPPAEFVPILKGAHVFAQTATVEPFPRGLLWALAAGCVGIVEYQARSSAHELVENCERGVRVTNPQELADEVVAAAGHERASINEAFADFDHADVLQSYEQLYETERDDYGFF